MVWARSTVNDLTVPVAGTVVDALSSFQSDYGANLIGATVIRVRGVVSGSPNVSTGPSQMVLAATVGNATEVAAGGGPFDQPYRDWALWEPFVFRFAGITGNEMNRDQAVSRLIDVKAMRKVEEIDEEYRFWVQANQQAWTISWNLSVLLKLP